MHEAHADRSNSVAPPREHTKNPTARPIAESERPSLSPGDGIADDVDVTAEYGLDFRQRYSVSKTFRQVPAIPLEAAEMHRR
jgi:hypothetical protein